MFFTKFGAVLAWLGFIYGAFVLSVAVIIATVVDDNEQRQAFAKRYFASEDTGEAIDGVLPVLFVAVVLGILVEISRSLARSRG